MDSSKDFENLHFNRAINIIPSFPASFPTHWHKYVEVIAYPYGSGISKPCKITISQVDYLLTPGDLIFIWPGELHEISQNENRKLMGVQFSPTLFNEVPDFSPYLRHFKNYHLLNHDTYPELSENLLYHFQQIFLIQKNDNPFRSVEALICLLELFIELGTYVKNNRKSPYFQASDAKDKTLEKMEAACTYISENCEAELTLEKVAEYAGFSACYFSRIFKQMTTYNFVDYLAQQRIKKAQTLLSDSDMSVTEIAYQSGFKSISTFNRVFKQCRGCSPSEYRKYYFL